MKFDKNAKIFVAGGRGLVGSTIVKQLHQKGYFNLITPTRQELDLRRQSDVEKFFESVRPKYVFLAAAKVGGIYANNTYRAEFIYDNLGIALNVIHSAYKFGVEKLLNLGSSCIYPKFASQPLKEEYLLTGALEPTNEPYAIAKITAIKLCLAYNSQYGTNFMSVMPTNLYGEQDNFNLETSHVLPALIRKFILAKALNENNFEYIYKDISLRPLGFGLEKKIASKSEQSIITGLAELGIFPDKVLLWGTGKALREFLYVGDLADACVFIMENYSSSDVEPFVNIGVGRDISIAELARLVQSVVGFDGAIEFDSTKPDGTPQKLLDISKVRSLGWEAKTSLEEGIQRVVDWYYRTTT